MRRMYSLKQLQEIANAQAVQVIESGLVDNAKPIYWHNVRIARFDLGVRAYDITLIILNNNSNLLTKNDVLALLRTPGFIGVAHSGRMDTSGVFVDFDTTPLTIEVRYVKYKDGSNVYFDYLKSTGELTQNLEVGISTAVVNDLGANKIN